MKIGGSCLDFFEAFLKPSSERAADVDDHGLPIVSSMIQPRFGGLKSDTKKMGAEREFIANL